MIRINEEYHIDVDYDGFMVIKTGHLPDDDAQYSKSDSITGALRNFAHEKTVEYAQSKDITLDEYYEYYNRVAEMVNEGLGEITLRTV